MKSCKTLCAFFSRLIGSLCRRCRVYSYLNITYSLMEVFLNGGCSLRGTLQFLRTLRMYLCTYAIFFVIARTVCCTVHTTIRNPTQKVMNHPPSHSFSIYSNNHYSHEFLTLKQTILINITTTSNSS
jgi:hypothetical protein